MSLPLRTLRPFHRSQLLCLGIPNVSWLASWGPLSPVWFSSHLLHFPLAFGSPHMQESAGLSGNPESSCLSLPNAVIIAQWLFLKVGSRRSDSGPHACKAGVLSTEPSSYALPFLCNELVPTPEPSLSPLNHIVFSTPTSPFPI